MLFIRNREHFPVESVGCASEEVSSSAVVSTKILPVQAAIASLGPDDRGTGHIRNSVDTLPKVAAVHPKARHCRSLFETKKQKQLFEEELAQQRKIWNQLKGAGIDQMHHVSLLSNGRVDMGDGRAVIPAMSHLVPAELSAWLEERHAARS